MSFWLAVIETCAEGIGPWAEKIKPSPGTHVGSVLALCKADEKTLTQRGDLSFIEKELGRRIDAAGEPPDWQEWLNKEIQSL